MRLPDLFARRITGFSSMFRLLRPLTLDSGGRHPRVCGPGGG